MSDRNLMVHPMDRKNHIRILEGINTSNKPTEIIKFKSISEAFEFCTHISDGEKHMNEMPSDIILWGQLSSPYLYIDLGQGYGAQIFLADHDKIIQMFEQYMDNRGNEEDLTTENINPIGIVRVFDIGGVNFFDVPFGFGDDGDLIALYSLCGMGGKEGVALEKIINSPESLEIMLNTVPESLDYILDMLKDSVARAGVAIDVWYTAQILLLNPIIEIKYKTTVFENPLIFKNRGKNKKQPKKYIKQITFNLDDVQICNAKNKKEYKEPIWWVQGHWREYKNGKRIFVQGYWKGPERYKKVLSEPREREF